MTDDIIDFQKWRRKHESRTKRKMDNILKIIKWSSDMQKRGLMPPDVARAFHEYFSGEELE